MPDDPTPLTLDQHLAKGYDFIVHGRVKGWSPQAFGAALRDDAEMKTAATRKLASLSSIMRTRGEASCFVTKTQVRVLTDGLAKSREES